MAQMENLDNLEMTVLEGLLKACLMERPDISGHILSSREMSDYVLYLVGTYGKEHGKVTEGMLPYFTPDNGMTGIAAEVAAHPENRHFLQRLSEDLAEQKEEGFIAPGQDISVGRMLRYFPSNWHTNTYFTVYYAFSGTCPIHFQDEVILLGHGDVLIVAPGIVHATPCYADDAVLAFYMLRTSTFKRVFWNQMGEDNLLSKFFHLALSSEQATAYLHFMTGDDPEVRHILLQIYQEHQEDRLYAKQMIHSLMELFFLLILRRYEGTARLPRTEYFFWKHQFSAILSYIKTHYTHATLASVAEKFSYSQKQVGRIVRDCTGENFGDLVRQMKMKKAADLLRDRRLAPEQVAEAVGYATVNSFYRSFTDYYGQPPLEWLEHAEGT